MCKVWLRISVPKERFCTKQDTALVLAGVKREEDGSKEVKRGKALSWADGRAVTRKGVKRQGAGRQDL